MAGGWSLGFQGFSIAQLLLTQRLGQWSVDSGVERPPRKGKRGPLSHPILVAPGEGLRLPDQRPVLAQWHGHAEPPRKPKGWAHCWTVPCTERPLQGHDRVLGVSCRPSLPHPPGSPWVADGGLSAPQPGQTLLGWAPAFTRARGASARERGAGGQAVCITSWEELTHCKRLCC